MRGGLFAVALVTYCVGTASAHALDQRLPSVLFWLMLPQKHVP
jgi:hypothetical protein